MAVLAWWWSWVRGLGDGVGLRIVRRVSLGRSGIEVSMVMVGGGTIGGIGSVRATWGKGLTDDEAFQMLDTAVGMGINVVDTANSYAGGHSEEVIGAWLRERSADVLVATKVGNLVEADQVDICLGSDHILRQFPASLQRLGLDKVDLYLSHAPDNSTPIAETLEAFASLIEAGQVGAIGACNISATQLTEALVEADRLGLPRYEWVQNEYSVLARDDEATVIPICRDHGLGYTPHSVLSGGVLSGKFLPGAELLAGTTVALRPSDYAPYLTAEVLEGVQRWAGEAKRLGVGGAALALAWVLSSDDVTAALVGARRAAQFADVSNALELRLDPDQRERLAGLVR